MKHIKFAQKLSNELIRAQDAFNANHMEHTSDLAGLLAEELKEHFNFTQEEIDYIRAFASLHDIGKLSLPKEILFKQDTLSSAERALIQTHTTMGKVIVDRVLSNKEYGVELNDVATKILYDMVYHHHERIDGSGYPEKLKGDEVSPYMRIMAIADSYEAMTGHRPYRKSLTHEKAIQRLQSCVDGGKLDAHCLAALKKITNEKYVKEPPSDQSIS